MKMVNKKRHEGEMLPLSVGLCATVSFDGHLKGPSGAATTTGEE